jgi:hypothetical protein
MLEAYFRANEQQEPALEWGQWLVGCRIVRSSGLFWRQLGCLSLHVVLMMDSIATINK